MDAGDHIKVFRGLYWHHGIYIGLGRVIHFSGVDRKDTASVRPGTLEEFEAGGEAVVVQYDQCFAAEDVVRRACELLGTTGYNVVSFNCESAARWCKTGEAKSEQVRRAASGLFGGTGTGVAASAGLGFASSVLAPTLSGAAQTSATLASVGGSMIGGTAVLSAIPAAVAVAAFHAAMADDPALSGRERAARASARRASKWAAAGTVAAGVLAIALGGAGLGAAGTAAALKAFGAAVGGGMAAGVTVIGGGAALIAAAIGWWTYKRAGGGLDHLPIQPSPATT